MNLTYAQRKRINSLAKRYLHRYDGLIESKELNEIYYSDFILFVEQLLVDLYGYKKEDPSPIRHRPRKIGTRPPKRKPGQRPPRIGEILKSGETSEIIKHEKRIKKEIENSVDQTKPSWYKKAWRKTMMQVHPDRVDSVSRDDIDKLERLKIGSRLSLDSSPCLLVACTNKLDLTIDLNVYEQERMLRVAIQKVLKETKNIQQSVQWIWGESVVDTNIRVQILKNVLKANGIKPLDDGILIQYISKNAIQ